MQQISATQLKEDSNLLRIAKDGKGSKPPYPKSVFFIVGNEFCERFSYYGMRAILILYLTSWLSFTNNTATAIYHGFSVLCYFSPVIGAVLADGYLGKYNTILGLSLVYVAGNIVMTFTAFPPPFWVGPMFGLILIGLGTGGIKPCVSAFGGDQFTSDQETERDQFFSVFYFSINLGSLLSTIITPLVREYTSCFGSNCFPVAFGIPAILMMIAIFTFVFGRRFYKIQPPTGSVINRMAGSIGRAIKNKWNSSEKKEHWLYYADDLYDVAFLDDVKAVLRVFWLFIPLPVFWALFDQQGSRWTIQATQLNLHVTGNLYILPDQIQAVNSLLILLFIPIFEFIIYPLLNKCKVPNRPLQRMVAGMLLAACAFVAAGFLQLNIDSTSEDIHVSSGSYSKFGFINSSPCPVSVAVDSKNSSNLQFAGIIKTVELSSGSHTVLVDAHACSSPFIVSQTVELLPQKAYFMYSYIDDEQPHLSELIEYPLARSQSGGPLVGVSVINDTKSVIYTHAIFKQGETLNKYRLGNVYSVKYVELLPGEFTVGLVLESGEILYDSRNVLRVEPGQVITVIINANDTGFQFISIENVHANAVPFWNQIPQYVIITMGEVLFSITGLSFAYSQAPESMKSVVSAAWLMTTGFGDIIVIFVASVHLLPQAAEFFFFAALMALATVVYAIMGYFYKSLQPALSETNGSSDLQQLTASAESVASEKKDLFDNTNFHS